MAYTPTHQPSGFETCVQHVVSELPRRGIDRKDSTGSALREWRGIDLAASQDVIVINGAQVGKG
jgi:hypothetical protein